jgi:hypothetical protein
MSERQATLKELIEQASSHADANLQRGKRPYPLGAAIRPDGSKVGFRLEDIHDNDRAAANIKSLLLQHNAVRYVLTLPAISKGKQYVLFSAEGELGMMFARREIKAQPSPHLGPLEIVEHNIAEGPFVGLLPRQAPLDTG